LTIRSRFISIGSCSPCWYQFCEEGAIWIVYELLNREEVDMNLIVCSSYITGQQFNNIPAQILGNIVVICYVIFIALWLL
jgi:hypothetical protein